MGQTDQWVNVCLVTSITVYIAAWLTGWRNHQLLFYIAGLNLLSATLVLICWIQKQWCIKQHFIDWPEATMLCFETAVAALCIYFFVSRPQYSWLKIAQYIVFAVHFFALLFFLVFMLTFKMNRLI